MTFGEKLKLLRQRSGQSQTELADALCVSRAAVAKWENDIGLPELFNAKAIADHFHVDLDWLVDNTQPKQLPDPVPVNPPTFCGKECASCAEKEALNCPGCKAGPAKLYAGSCPVAKCCRSRDIRSCHACALKHSCMTYGTSNQQSVDRLRVQEEQSRRAMYYLQHVPVLGPSLMGLFWTMIISQIVSSFFGLFQLKGKVVSFEDWLSIVGVVICGYYLLRIRSEDRRFLIAGLVRFGQCILTVLFFSYALKDLQPWPVVLFSLGVLGLELLASYFMYTAMSYVMTVYNSDLADSWDSNLYLKMVGTIGMGIALVLLLVATFFGIIILIISCVFIIVESIRTFITLGRCAYHLRDFV